MAVGTTAGDPRDYPGGGAACHRRGRKHEHGLRLRDENHNEEALGVFQQIYERTREPRALARMALAEGALNRWADAEGHLIEAIAARRDRWIRHNRAGLMQNLQVIRSHLGTVQVSCNVPGAQVVIRSGRPVTVPLPQVLRLSEGPNELEVFAEGYVTARQPITVVPGATLSVVVALAAEPPAPPPPPPPPEPAPEPPPPPPLVCPGAQVSNPQTLGHCCWPGQVYSTVAQSCTGSPSCPSGMIAAVRRARRRPHRLRLSGPVRTPTRSVAPGGRR
nr:PEGA domain-containing protein [Deltaproteobacteria bacterium]